MRILSRIGYFCTVLRATNYSSRVLAAIPICFESRWEGDGAGDLLGGHGFGLGQQVLLFEEFVELASDMFAHLATMNLIRHRRSARFGRQLLPKLAPGVLVSQT